jgi:predicted ArsR family transcriptional regulator
MSFDRRQLTTAADLRALSHPLRMRLVELLRLGAATATQAAAELGTTPANCSFHLRLLARHGFVQEASGGVGRARPWQLVERDNYVVLDQLDAEGLAALRAIEELQEERRRQRKDDFWRSKEQFPAAWRAAATQASFLLHLTAEESQELNAALEAVVARYLERGQLSARRPGTAPVDLSISSFPLRQPLPGEENG